ncbi:hypothetical protein [Frigoribacterium sp. Leaf8]|uniref:hypothetical protein n=1 Tax=Frigoribacterium sp. Leaf8 TaxID=1735673 RepID=UPI000A4333AE|nr:hypothetical protein [Frigoribacterium sp. Leaf8]
MFGRQVDVSRVSEDDESVYDAFFGVCGYESRSSALAQHLGSRVRSLFVHDYNKEPVLSYAVNRAYYEKAGATFSDTTAWTKVPQVPLPDGEDLRAKRFAVDISSMDRDVLSHLVAILAEADATVDFYYSPAEFSPNLSGSSGTITVNRPALGLEGWTSTPDMPLVSIIGLGFEGELALAAVESLEPSDTFVFSPRGLDSRYDSVVDDKNSIVLAMSGHVSAYALGEPLTLYRKLDTATWTLRQSARVVFVPLGPKLFALASAIVAVKHGSQVSVWRVSSGQDRIPEERHTSALPVGLRVIFGVGNNLGLDRS